MGLGKGRVWRPLASLFMFGLLVGFVDGWPAPHVATVILLAVLAITDVAISKLRNRKTGTLQ